MDHKNDAGLRSQLQDNGYGSSVSHEVPVSQLTFGTKLLCL